MLHSARPARSSHTNGVEQNFINVRMPKEEQRNPNRTCFPELRTHANDAGSTHTCNHTEKKKYNLNAGPPEHEDDEPTLELQRGPR